jgi:rhodanese-related sulfurtransferase
MKQFCYALVFAFMAIANTAFAGEQVAEVSVSTVQALVAAKSAKVALLDANNEQARAAAGMLPGAIKLSSYNQYALTELPADKATTLVFYCYNSYCQASHAAAQRAIGAGYQDVRVMKAGIVGWNEAEKAKI